MRERERERMQPLMGMRLATGAINALCKTQYNNANTANNIIKYAVGNNANNGMWNRYVKNNEQVYTLGHTHRRKETRKRKRK